MIDPIEWRELVLENGTLLYRYYRCRVELVFNNGEKGPQKTDSDMKSELREFVLRLPLSEADMATATTAVNKFINEVEDWVTATSPNPNMEGLTWWGGA